jgi:hypothetical protein
MSGSLTAGEWSALIYQTPDPVRGLVYRLAIHHGAVERTAPDKCPICGKAKAGQLELEETHEG